MYQDNIFRIDATSEGRADNALPATTNGHKFVERRIGLRNKKSRQDTNEAVKPVFRSVRSTRDGGPVPTANPQSPTARPIITNGTTKSNASDETEEPRQIEAMGGVLDMYTTHFGLTSRPFTLVPDPEFLFWSPAHRGAFTMLEYGTLTGAPITLITGEIGAGKTTLVQKFLRDTGKDVTIGLISNSQGSRGELLQWVLMALDQTAEHGATYVNLFEKFQKFLISEYAAGKRVILIFDEAQNLSIESLEELRMFTNINSNKDELLQLVLVGQPDLFDTIHSPELRQFAQRVAANFHLGAIDEEQVAEYVAHRLRIAGSSRNFFAEDACRRIYEKTGGVPRLVNQICDLSMVYTSAKNQKTVTVETVDEVLADGAFFYARAFPEENAN